MRDRKALELSKYLPFSATITAGLIASSAAHALTADDVMNKMNDDERFSYLAGVVEGLAQARWIAENPDSTGMDCVHGWFYGSGDRKWDVIQAFFHRHQDKPAAALLYVLIKQDCGA